MTDAADTDAEAAAAAAAAAAAVEAVARTSYGRLVAYLGSITGDLAAAEDAMGDALVAALTTWRRTGIPDRPDSWLVTAARRTIIDGWRRTRTRERSMQEIARILDERAPDATDEVFDIPDKRLELLFACAHPAVDPAMRTALMLQAVLGTNAARIASAFLVAPSTMGQRLVRTKAKIKEAGVPFAVPDTTELHGRTGAVLDAIYVAYTIGWDDEVSAAADIEPSQGGFGDEAVRLARLAVELLPRDPEARGLLALLLHSSARSRARIGPADEFVPLDEQDPSSWSRVDIDEAETHLEAALGMGRLGPYQLQAAIQSVHNRRAATGETDWAAIARLHEGLMALSPTIGAAVARAAAVARTEGAASALALLDELPADMVSTYQPYWVVRAHCLDLAGERTGAAEAASVALRLTPEGRVKRHLAATYAPSTTGNPEGRRRGIRPSQRPE